MARAHGKYGKDHPERFIDGALDGDIGEHGAASLDHDTPHGFQDSSTSNEIVDYPVDRKHQVIKTALALDNVGRVYDRFPTSLHLGEGHFHGSTRNLKHSVDGAEAPADGDVGASGPVKHDVIPWH
jgi:hypothetical protein